MLKQRFLTALLLSPILVALLVFLPLPGFMFFTALIFVWGAWEWTHLIEMKVFWQRIAYLGLFVVILGFAQYFSVSTLIISMVWWLLVCVFIFNYSYFTRWWQSYFWLRMISGLLFLIPAWVACNLLRSQNQGSLIVVGALALVWLMDIAAYFVGRGMGRHKLAPMISPGKTVEGVIGSVFAAVFVGGLATGFMNISLGQWFIFLLLFAVMSLIAVVGDLFESMAKRQSGVKDSGHFLPGHGGILDRLDSVVAAIPFFTFSLFILGYLGR
jgi:phosphatidate cytidylyltransferase